MSAKIPQAMYAFINTAYGELVADSLKGYTGRSRTGQSVYSVEATRRLNQINRAIEAHAFTVLSSQTGQPKDYSMMLEKDWESRMKPGCKVRLQLDDELLQAAQKDYMVEFVGGPPMKTMRLAQVAAAEAVGDGSPQPQHQRLAPNVAGLSLTPSLSPTVQPDKVQRRSFSALREKFGDLKRG